MLASTWSLLFSFHFFFAPFIFLFSFFRIWSAVSLLLLWFCAFVLFVLRKHKMGEEKKKTDDTRANNIMASFFLSYAWNKINISFFSTMFWQKKNRKEKIRFRVLFLLINLDGKVDFSIATSSLAEIWTFGCNYDKRIFFCIYDRRIVIQFIVLDKKLVKKTWISARNRSCE